VRDTRAVGRRRRYVVGPPQSRLAAACTHASHRFHTQAFSKNSINRIHSRLHTHTHTFDGPFPGNIQVSRYQEGKTNLDFTEARDSEWQWHQSAPRSRQITTPTPYHSVFLQAGCPSCRPTNSVKALKATISRKPSLQIPSTEFTHVYLIKK